MSIFSTAVEPATLGHVHVALVDTALDQRRVVTAWLDEQHAHGVLDQGGWERVRRYQCSSDVGLQLLVYDRPSTAEPAGPVAFRSKVGRRLIRTFAADTFETISEYGSLAETPEFINAIAIQVAPEGADAFNRWYDEVHVPEIVACPGWLGARRYRSHSERARFLAIYDLSDLTSPFESEEYDGAVGWDALENVLLGYHGFRTYALEASAELATPVVRDAGPDVD